MFAIVTNLCLITLLSFRCSADNVDPQFYPTYHLAPPHGWMNDPNGFIYFREEYHLFFQYNPHSSQEPGTAHWGHAKSNDLFNWEHLPIAMYPDKDYDKDGVFSGSAIEEDNKMYLFYTGNVNHEGETPDHNNRQALAYSSDGVNVTKYPDNLIIYGEDFQPDFRDPKVWKHRDQYYMVLGNSFDNSTRGRVLLFKSENLIDWRNVSVLEQSDGDLGYMWECPDFFELNKKWILLFSPQGIEPQGYKYRNLYQVGYFVGDFDYETNMFTVTSEFRELDHGHDFYATQSLSDKFGRRVMVAWDDMWEQVYPELDDGWTGQMTIPRELYLSSDQRLIQRPVREIRNVRASTLYSDRATAGTTVKLSDNAAEIKVTASSFHDFELTLDGGNNTFVNISYDYLRGRVTLERNGDDGIRRTRWRPSGTKLRMQIFVDRSSVELFCGEGEVTFSSRFFPCSEVTMKLGENSCADDLSVYSMRRTMPKP